MIKAFLLLFVCSADPAALGVLGENPLRVLVNYLLIASHSELKEGLAGFSPSTPGAAECAEANPNGSGPRSDALVNKAVLLLFVCSAAPAALGVLGENPLRVLVGCGWVPTARDTQAPRPQTSHRRLSWQN